MVGAFFVKGQKTVFHGTQSIQQLVDDSVPEVMAAMVDNGRSCGGTGHRTGHHGVGNRGLCHRANHRPWGNVCSADWGSADAHTDRADSHANHGGIGG